MADQLLTFEDFIKRIIKVVFWVILLIPLIGVPLYYLLDVIFKFNPDIFALALTKPDQFLTFQLQLLSSEPFHSIFLWTTFPGFTFAALFSSIIMIYWERKFTAKIQLRVGPQYAGKFEGILQNFADLFKLLFKEIVIPDTSDKLIFLAAPFAIFGIVGALLAIVPLGPNSYIADPSVGVLLVFAITGFFPIVAVLAGWASNSKYPLIGGLRALHQLVAYEVPLILSLLGIVLLSGTLDILKIVYAQGSIGFIVYQPLGAIVFYFATLAELERIPFDIPEADTELVAGWQTEYTGMAFGLINVGVFIKFYALAGLFTAFFLGGWYGPGFLPPEVWFILKTFLVMTVMMLPRATMVRIRIDQMLRAGWTKLIVLAFLNLFLTMLIVSLGLVKIGGI
jgi:NADH-quinone oxidoreductase subunit H